MAVKISELLDIKSLKGIKLISGEPGLENEVTSMCIADLAFDKNNMPHANTFRNGSLVVGSMRGCDQGSFTLKEVVSELIKRKASGLIFDKHMAKVSDEIKNLCEKNKFPLITYDPEKTYIENVIFEVMYAIQASGISFSMEMVIDKLINEVLSSEEVLEVAETINEDMHSECIAAYIHASIDGPDFNAGRAVKNFSGKYEDEDTTVNAYTYKGGIGIIITMPRMDERKSEKILDDMVKQINKKNLIVATGNIHRSLTELDMAIKECRFAYLVARLERKSRMEYGNIGVYQLLLPQANSREADTLINKYISHLNKEQLETALEFVNCKGDYDETAKALICHRNTVRYRISKIHEKMDSDKKEAEFYENLSIAVKLYLIRNHRSYA